MFAPEVRVGEGARRVAAASHDPSFAVYVNRVLDPYVPLNDAIASVRLPLRAREDVRSGRQWDTLEAYVGKVLWEAYLSARDYEESEKRKGRDVSTMERDRFAQIEAMVHSHVEGMYAQPSVFDEWPNRRIVEESQAATRWYDRYKKRPLSVRESMMIPRSKYARKR